jgi:cytochrome c oxidase subunit 2
MESGSQMKFGDIARKWLHVLPLIAASLALVSLPQASLAQAAGAAVPPVASSVQTPAVNGAAENAPAVAAEPSSADAAPAADASGYTPLGPEWIKGQPTPGALGFQKQYSKIGEEALFMHDAVLLPVITAVTLLVLGLLLWVVYRYRRGRNPVPSKTSHNTVIEVIWTAVPVLILVVIAVPSITLLAHQYQSPPNDALTVKVTGYQWYWGYTYPDNGGFEVISNMLPEEEALKRGEPSHLGADNRMVVPVGEPIRLQVTGADVIHSFAVPSLWFKIDAVPGRLNERMLFVEEPGIYYGQCSELCGARHGYMPIAVEAVPRAQFEAYIRSKGGTLGGDEAASAPPPEAEGAPAAPASGEEA